MPRKSNPHKVAVEPRERRYADASGGKSEWGGFCNAKVDEETKQAYHEWLQQEGSYWFALAEEAVDQGLKLGLSWDEDNTSFIASFTGCGVLGSSLRYCLTARSSKAEDAIALLVFKHVVMAKSDWGSYRPSNGKFDSWG